MGLEKAISHYKEKRKPFGKETGTYMKSIDCTCRNHGSCLWCLENRTYKNKKIELATKQKLRDYNIYQ